MANDRDNDGNWLQRASRAARRLGGRATSPISEMLRNPFEYNDRRRQNERMPGRRAPRLPGRRATNPTQRR